MIARRIIAVLLAVAMAAFLVANVWPLSDQADGPVRVSERFLDRGLQETGAVNIVSAVLLDYRGFDTLGETVVILATALAVGALLGQGRRPPTGRGLSVLVRRSIAFLAPLFWLMPAYIVVNGHLSPGGGFQGGVGWATLLVLLAVVYGSGAPRRLWPPNTLQKIEYAAALCFLGLGLYGLIRVGAFLSNRAAGFSMGIPGTLPSAGVIPWLNLAIGVKVMAGLAAIFFYMQRDEELAS